ncbi:MAG TPA: peptidylprolyl isomerase [Gammaproteobacteria bacterium]|nr:peptidylprolyl isomerase [Gammaproteobacteria bacterium]
MPHPVVAKHKVVSISYSILDENGTVLEQSDIPVAYVHGGPNQMFPEVEAALEGKAVGERVEVTLSPEQAFGPSDPSLTFTDDIDNVPPQFRHVGAQVEMQNEAGDVRTFVVSKIEDGRLTVDGNHPFAGKTLTFSVTVNDIRDATAEEKIQGVSQSPIMH